MKTILSILAVLMLSGCAATRSVMEDIGVQAETVQIEVIVSKDGKVLGHMICRREKESGKLVTCEPYPKDPADWPANKK